MQSLTTLSQCVFELWAILGEADKFTQLPKRQFLRVAKYFRILVHILHAEPVEGRGPFSRFLFYIAASVGAHSSLLKLVSVLYDLVLV